ncbi:Protein CBG24224 [Caenorhabditis briggsae]|uniref:Protein CBG24224 n=1 Tax=Caenorhabditis briggsae TaxID=6238 RepID=A8WK90_CAEBR|nr:Protein CBG24224 [Caenorhabditis briggsae]CAP20883.1 Protein CBG24224 [Caenorhabditis briggsae]
MRASPHRQTIAKLFNDGISTGDIARRLLLPRATVYRVVQQLKDRGHVLELKKSGRPRTVNTRRTRGIIKKRITRNDAVSMNQMASSLGISRQSVQSIVKKDLGLNSYRLLRGQYLTEQSKKNRLEKAKKLLDALKVMVWAGLTSEGKVPLVFIDRNVKINSDVYQKLVLMDVLRPWVTSHFGQQPFILQQDWAPSHGSKSTKAVLDAHFPGYWGKDMWPASSPDLNPLDFSVWGYLEEKVMARSHPNVDSLKAALLKAWDDLDDDYLRRTVASVRARLKACIKAEGSNFEYLL